MAAVIAKVMGMAKFRPPWLQNPFTDFDDKWNMSLAVMNTRTNL